MTDYQAMLADLFPRAANGIKLGLAPMRSLLRRMGSPHQAFDTVVVAGTNGKGTTTHALAAALCASGHRTARFTSPHLTSFRERFAIDGVSVSEELLVDAYRRVAEADQASERPATFFEYTVAMAFTVFAEANVDIAVLEVGLGGRLDATNVVSRRASIITPIAMDHQHYLGNTIEEIAGEKAGIIQPGRPVVVAPQPPAARRVIVDVATNAHAEIVPVREGEFGDRPAVLHAPFGPPFTFDPEWHLPAHLRVGIACAVTAARILQRDGLAVPDVAMRPALESSSWMPRGRYEWFGDALMLDCAHNVAGLEALVDALDNEPRAADRPLHFVFTVLKDREPEAMAGALAGFATSVAVPRLRGIRGREPAALMPFLPQSTAHDSVENALREAQARATADGGLVVVAGSMLLVGEALAHLSAASFDEA